MYVANDTKQYQKYFDAYKSLTINLAKLLIKENKSNESSDSNLTAAWDQILKLETKIARVNIYNNHKNYINALFIIL